MIGAILASFGVFGGRGTSDSGTGSFYISHSDSSSVSSSDSSAESSQSSLSSETSASSDIVTDLDELVVIGPDGTALDVAMKIPSASELTTRLQISLYTGLRFTATDRKSTLFMFTIVDGYGFGTDYFNEKTPAHMDLLAPNKQGIETSVMNVWQSESSVSVTATYDASDPLTGGYYGVYVRACKMDENGNPRTSEVMEPASEDNPNGSIALNITLTQDGKF